MASCGEVVRENGTYFVNPNHPNQVCLKKRFLLILFIKYIFFLLLFLVSMKGQEVVN